MANERKIAELRETVRNLEIMLGHGLSSSSQAKDVSIIVNNERFYDRIISFKVDPNSNENLNEMIYELTRLKIGMELSLKELRKSVNIFGQKSERQYIQSSEELQKWYSDLSIMKNLNGEELEARKRSLELNEDDSPRDFRNRIKAEIERISEDISAAQKMLLVNNNLDLLSAYDKLLDTEAILDKEVKFRDENRALTRQYEAMCNIYNNIKAYSNELENFDGNEARKLSLQRRLGEEKEKLKLYLSEKDVKKLEKAQNKTVLRNLRDEIEDVAFRLNYMNGMVDKNVLKADVAVLNKVNDLQDIEFNHNIDLEISRLSRLMTASQDMIDNPELATAKAEWIKENDKLKIPTRIMNDLSSKLEILKKEQEKIKKELETLKNNKDSKKEDIDKKEKELKAVEENIAKKQKQYDERDAKVKEGRKKVAMLYDKIQKMPEKVPAVSKEQKEIQDKINVLEKQKKVKPELLTPEMIEYKKKLWLMSLIEELKRIFSNEEKLQKSLKRRSELNGKDFNTLTENEKKELKNLEGQISILQQDKNRISTLTESITALGKGLKIKELSDATYLNSVDNIENYALASANKKIKSQLDKAAKERRRVCKKYEVNPRLENDKILATIKERTKSVETSKRTVAVNLEEDLQEDQYANASQSTHNDVSAPSSAVAMPTPKATVQRIDYDEFARQFRPRQSSTSKKEGNTRPRSNNKSNSSKDEFFIKFNTDDAEVHFDTVDAAHKRRIENGMVYRYERGENLGELYYIEEDLNSYLKNPKKVLNEVLNDLRDRMIKEFGSEEGLEHFCRDNDDAKLLEGLVSKNPIRREIAKRKFIKEINVANPNGKALAYASMAIALNSEVTTEGVISTLSKSAQPYCEKSDMLRYVECENFLGTETLKINKDKLAAVKKTSEIYETAKRSSTQGNRKNEPPKLIVVDNDIGRDEEEPIKSPTRKGHGKDEGEID